MNAPWITGEHSKLLIHMVMRAFLLDVAIYTLITKDFLLPLGGSVSAVPLFQLRPVFSAVSSRVPPGDTMSRFVGPGDKSWDNFKKGVRTNSWTIRSG